MNYVYDILVNFKYPLIDFYEWNKGDNIENIKKIPLCKINKDDFIKFKNNRFKLNNIDAFKNGTKLFNNKKKTYNAIIYTDGFAATAFNFDEKGICISKSSLLIEEESEIIDSANLIPETSINYELLGKDKLDLTRTRKEESITKYLIKEISRIEDINKFNYICYECFGEIKNLTKKSLIDLIKDSWDDRYYKIYDFLTLISMNKR